MNTFMPPGIFIRYLYVLKLNRDIHLQNITLSSRYSFDEQKTLFYAQKSWVIALLKHLWIVKSKLDSLTCEISATFAVFTTVFGSI